MKPDALIQFVEPDGIPRTNEPITMGIPFPKGRFYENDLETICLMDPTEGALPIQTKPPCQMA